MSENQQKLAVLIDADNASPKQVADLFGEIAKFGTAFVRRIYGDWTTDQLKGWKKDLPEYAIQPIQQFAHTTRKNSTDSAMIIDAMDLLYTGRFDAFCLVTSDSDFTRLASRIREDGLDVYGFGARKTPAPFRNACTTFVYLDSQNASKSTNKTENPEQRLEKRRTELMKQFNGNAGLIKAIRETIADISDDDGWARLGPLGSKVRNAWPDFLPRNYGFSRLSDLLERSHLFELRKGSSGIFEVRDRKPS
ncbi:NYN domain-containing protein [Haloferula rosea]|uniref:NYN domain-containing protein n=1 Tax=Haloferula rosea TaxID=490093 RepID=A0A934RG55_9BACT|nr:NYN domain-containing protein [Haloferula rosea]MBK1828564.1 NYN domain-containing protein [Haloferula rosea]